MLISLNWLKRYVDIDLPIAELCDRMVMSGFEVESITDLSQTMSRVVVGQIVKLEKHPDADKLQICQLDIGDAEPVQIVTGADNVFEGALVPVALHDSHLPNGMHIKKGKLRGVPSNGMLCSGEELCLKESDYPGAEVYGIMILKDSPVPGTDMREVLHLDDYIIDFKITANRPDCQSVLGVAREIAVVLNKPFNAPRPEYTTVGGNIHDEIKVSVEDTDLCPRYMGRIVKNLRIGPSPDWMKRCLKAAGMRPINNIVDITNFVMLETGQPMHAFDMRHVAGNELCIRRAKPGETITTLDGKAHALTPDMLVIADRNEPSCIAGIMGGENSEIEDDTTTLFFESAKFRRDSVRRTGRALGIRTESSGRFERGLDIIGASYALDRALQLICELDAGDIIDGTIDLHDALPEPRTLTVPAQRINDLLGLDIPFETMVDILNRLHIETTLSADNVLTAKIPSFRDDIEGRADLAEEVMRIYGYDHIIGTPMRGEVARGQKRPQQIKTDKLKRLMIAQGMYEIATYSFISSKAVDTLNLAENDVRRQAVTLLNPLGEEYSTMRTQLITSMLTVLSTNYNRKVPAARLFEASKAFRATTLPPTEQPEEAPVLCIGMYGKEEDFFTLKGVVETLLETAGEKVTYTASNEPYLHPGRQAEAYIGDKKVAVFGELHPDVAAAYDLGTRVYTAEIELNTLFDVEMKPVLYRALPRFPAVERDLALLCDADLPVAEIEEVIRKAGGKLLETVALFDVYQGNQIEKGKKSVAFNLLFRSSEETLSDTQIEPAMQKIIKKLHEKGCDLRS